MRIFALLSFVLVATSSVSAASVTWLAGGFANDGAVTGVAYLIQSTSPVQQEAISDYLNQYGTSYSGEGFTLIGSHSLTSATNFQDVVVSYDAYNSQTLGNCFMIILEEDGGFILSDIRSLIDTSDVSGESASISFPAAIGDIIPGTDWVYGTVGGDEPVDPNVPEPSTCLMLTLLAAGVVLKRRTR